MGFEKHISDRTWQGRRVVWNKDALYLSRTNEDKIIDSIPLAEMTEIVPLHTAGNRKIEVEDRNGEGAASSLIYVHGNGLIGNAGEVEVLPALEAHKEQNSSVEGEIVQIKTLLDGLNSGRVYCFRSHQTGFSLNFCLNLTKQSKAARDRAEKLSRFQKHQAFLRELYHSTPFQVFVSFLILAVS